MLGTLTYIFWVLFVLAVYIGTKYKQSRNRHLFFKQGSYKAFIYSVIGFIGIGLLISIILPNDPIDLSFLKMHSDWVESHLNDESLMSKYFFQSISVFSELNLLGLVSATLILLIWMYYIRGLDFFNKEKLKPTLMILGLGMAFTFLTFPISEFVHTVFDIKYSNNTFYNLFVYSFLGIGIVEEFVKLIPVLLILKFSNEIDEPIDLIYYASISALGFAYIENLIYFRDLSGSIIIGRALTSAVGHMIDSSIVVYGIILYRYNAERKKISVILYYFLLGAFVHALYDYFLFEDLTLFFLFTFAFFIQSWTIMINNAINNSKYFTYDVIYKNDEVKFRLAIYFIGLILLSFVFNIFLVGKVEALDLYFSALFWGGLLIIFYVSSLSSFDLFQGHWRPIKFNFTSPSHNAFPGMRGLSTLTPLWTENTIVPMNHVGKEIKLHSPTYNRYLCEIFHISKGWVQDRIKLKYENGWTDIDWLLVKLETPLYVNEEYENDHILIKIRSKYQSLIHDEHIKCWLKLIPKGTNPKIESSSSSYTSYGFIMINGGDYEYDL